MQIAISTFAVKTFKTWTIPQKIKCISLAIHIDSVCFHIVTIFNYVNPCCYDQTCRLLSIFFDGFCTKRFYSMLGNVPNYKMY